MKYKLLLSLALIFSFKCSAQTDETTLITSIFNESGTTGTIVLYDLNNDKYISNDFNRAKEGFLPASTFKIFNSLAALETGAIVDENEIIKWDSIPRQWEMWDKDHNLRTAIKYSVVWFYQELARRIGSDKMQMYIDKSDYGNRNINGGIDLFWLQGDIRITPVEQIEFLRKLYSGNLPFSKRSLNIVKDIMIRRQSDEYIVRGKTGWAARTEPQTGWYVGYVETEENVWFFSMNMDINKNEDAQKREELTYLILNKLNIIK